MIIYTRCLVFDVGGLGFEFCMFVAGWRLALRSEWPFIIIIIWCSKYLSDSFICLDFFLLLTLCTGHFQFIKITHWQ